MDAYERVIAAQTRGIYESNYLKANSPDGERALWIKHNALVPVEGTGVGEFWAIAYRRGAAPVVVKREVAWSEVDADASALRLACGDISLAPDRARGKIASIAWDVRLSGVQPALFHLPYARMYTGSFPKKKLLTPQPNLRFDGELTVAGERWAVDGWVGLRGHNWGTEHAHSYAYGSVNAWDDGSAERTVDGFTVRIRLGGRTSPWLTAAVGRAPEVRKNRLRHWLGAGSVELTRWEARWPRARGGQPVRLEMTADPSTYAGLRYAHPDGRESYCYNTKFADVRYEVGGERWTSRCGELEVLLPEPAPGIRLHPAPGWDPAAGDYASDGG
jgi:hypothetical protein